MAQQRKQWSATQASSKEIFTGNYVKLENLVETHFTIVDVTFEPSNFDASKEQARVTITYDDDEDTEMAGIEFQFTTTQGRIMQRLRLLSEEDIPVGPVTIFETGRSQQYGTVFYDIGDIVPEIDSPATSPLPQVLAHVNPKVDIAEDSKRQRLAGQSLRSKSTR